jgi:hypothetical protein
MPDSAPLTIKASHTLRGSLKPAYSAAAGHAADLHAVAGKAMLAEEPRRTAASSDRMKAAFTRKPSTSSGKVADSLNIFDWGS